MPAPDRDAGATTRTSLVSLDDVLLRWFDGEAVTSGLPDKGRAGFTLSLTTVDEQGWPRTALLGLAEVFAPDSRHLVLALWQTSRSSHCLRARGRAVLSFVFEGRFHQWRLLTRRSEAPALAADAGHPVCHLMRLDGGEAQGVPYATLTSGMRYALADEAATLARWREQMGRMRQFAKGA